MNPIDMSVETWHWDKATATTEEVQVLIEALGYDISKVYYMTSDEEPYVSANEVSDRLPDFKVERTVNVEPLRQAIGQCIGDIETVLFNFVKQYGEEPTDYDINEFGLTEQDDGEGEITHVFNIFDNGGGYFAVQRTPNDDDVKDDADSEYVDTFEHYAFQCLYIVRDDDGDETLKYYAFENGGLMWDDELSEPDHDRVATLRLDVLYQLLQSIIKEWGEKK